MSSLSTLLDMSIVRAGKLDDSMVRWMQTKDPATATEVDINKLKTIADKAAGDVADAVTAANAAEKAAADIRASLQKYRDAAKALKGQLETADEAGKATIMGNLSQFIDKMKLMGGPEMDGSGGTLHDAVVEAQHKQAELLEHKAWHTHAVEEWTTFRQTAEQRQADLAKARRENEEAKRHQQEAEVMAKVRSSVNTGTASQAFVDEAAKLRRQTEAMKIQAEALRQSHGRQQDTDDLVDSVLAAQKPKPDLSADLAKL